MDLPKRPARYRGDEWIELGKGRDEILVSYVRVNLRRRDVDRVDALTGQDADQVSGANPGP